MTDGIERPLKICRTCRYWSWKAKGVCSRHDRAAGAFWSCAEWVGDPPVQRTEIASELTDVADAYLVSRNGIKQRSEK